VAHVVWRRDKSQGVPLKTAGLHTRRDEHLGWCRRSAYGSERARRNSGSGWTNFYPEAFMVATDIVSPTWSRSTHLGRVSTPHLAQEARAVFGLRPDLMGISTSLWPYGCQHSSKTASRMAYGLHWD
jgi:hypothetical protein